MEKVRFFRILDGGLVRGEVTMPEQAQSKGSRGTATGRFLNEPGLSFLFVIRPEVVLKIV